MTSVAVLIPVLGRPERVRPVFDSLVASDPRADPWFLCSPDDAEEIAALEAIPKDEWVSSGLRRVIVGWPPGHADYARKMNLGYELARTDGYDWVFLGADDLIFHPEWLDRCLRVWERTYACVIGTNDLGNARVIAGHHSTHTLVHTDYLECGGVADDPTRILCEAYDHNFVDDEFVQTAMARGTYAHAHYAMVEHLHPNWAKGQEDETYRKGVRRFADDQKIFARRRSLFRATSTTRRV